MSTENSSTETSHRAEVLATQLNTYHLHVPIDSLVQAFLSLFEIVTGKFPRFTKKEGGSYVENLAKQNLINLASHLFIDLSKKNF